VLRKVVLPLAAPGIAVSAIFCLLFSWNEFLVIFGPAVFLLFDAGTEKAIVVPQKDQLH
jgi:ABC-type glycerol-3-phosphate transport system permease component